MYDSDGGGVIPPAIIETAADGVVAALEAALAGQRESIVALCLGDQHLADMVLSASIGRAFVRATVRTLERECGKAPPYAVVADMLTRAGRVPDGPLLAELRREYAR